jgi:Arm domain-containing DNA-binding protein
MPLTDLAIKRMKPADRPFRKSDGGGLFIEVKPRGSKLWRMAYRFGGKQKLDSEGRSPEAGRGHIKVTLHLMVMILILMLLS